MKYIYTHPTMVQCKICEHNNDNRMWKKCRWNKIVCHHHSFTRGKIYRYEELKQNNIVKPRQITYTQWEKERKKTRKTVECSIEYNSWQRVSWFEIGKKIKFFLFDNFQLSKVRRDHKCTVKGSLVISNNLFNYNIIHYNNTKRFHLYWRVWDLIRELLVNKCVERTKNCLPHAIRIDRCALIINGIEWFACPLNIAFLNYKEVMSNDAFILAVQIHLPIKLINATIFV